MAVKHKKTAGAARQSDPAIIDAPDWDDIHIYSQGDIFQFAYVDFVFNPPGSANFYGAKVTSSGLGEDDGEVVFQLNMAGLPVAAGAALTLRTFDQKFTDNSGLDYEVVARETGLCSIYFTQGGIPDLPSSHFVIAIMVSVEVLSP